MIAVLMALGTSGLALAQGGFTVTNVIKQVKKGVIRVQKIDIGGPVASGGYGGGSGFVFAIDYDKGEALAITNHHVSGNSVVCAVKFWDEAEYKAELVATEPGIDVSLIRIYGVPDERDLPDEEKTIVPCVLGDSDQVQIGEFGMAMGNPGAGEGFNIDRSQPYEDFLLHLTATTNVITGRDTPIEFELSIWRQARNSYGWQYGTNFDYAFRMSVPINGGNSGGPLFNSRGEVIGINFYGGSGALFQRSNHAIPINLAKDFVFQIMETGRFEKPWLGMDIIMPPWVRSPEEYIEFLELRSPGELTVLGIRPDSPAERAGLIEGDVILEVDGQVFETPEDVRLYIFELDIGSDVLLTIKRDGAKWTDPIPVEVVPKRRYNSEFSV
ncbi:trypsin-like peptidase domain-containing protein [bacterium]|nr:trypsin-like peptidase domain-containing protein [bacterium]